MASKEPKIEVGIKKFSLELFVQTHSYKNYSSSVGAPCPFWQKPNFKAQKYLISVIKVPKCCPKRVQNGGWREIFFTKC